MENIENIKNINTPAIGTQFYGVHIPDYTKIQVIFFNPGDYPSLTIEDSVLMIPNFYETETENEEGDVELPPPVTETFKLCYSKEKNSYMVADQSISKNSQLMFIFFKNRINFSTEELDMTTYNTILYSGE